MLKIIQKPIIKTVILIGTVLLFLSGCNGTTPSVNIKEKKENMPNWFTQKPTDQQKLYGVGTGTTVNQAVNDALINLLSEVAISIKDKSVSKVESTKDGYKELFVSKSIQEIKETFTSEYTIEKFQNLDESKLILLSLSKKDLIGTLRLNILSEKNNLESFNYKKMKNENILFRISKIKTALKYSKSMDYFARMLHYLNPNEKVTSATVSLESLLAREYANIKIEFTSHMNPKTYPLLKNKIDTSLKQIVSKEQSKKENQILFDLKSCSEGYRAIRGNRKFWESGGVDIYKGCNKVVVTDGNENEIYSKRIDGIKIKDYESVDQASEESFYSKNTQDGIENMLKEFRKHALLQYIMEKK